MTPPVLIFASSQLPAPLGLAGASQRDGRLWSALLPSFPNAHFLWFTPDPPASPASESEFADRFPGCRLHLIPYRMGGFIDRLYHRCAVPFGFRPSPADRLRSILARIPHPTLALARYLPIGLTLRRHLAPEVPCWLDIDDLPTDLLTSRLRHAKQGRAGRLITWTSLARHRLRDGVLLRRFDQRIYTSAADRRAACDTARGAVVPNVPVAVPADPPLPPLPSRELLFVGLLCYPPNRDALRFFLDRVWPTIHAARPDARLTIVGEAGGDPDIRSWNRRPGVRLVGPAADLGSYYRDCLATICPVAWGGGTKIKILESLAWRRCCIAHPHGADGIQAMLGPTPAIWPARSPDDWCRAILVMLDDRARGIRAAGDGWRRYRRHCVPDPASGIIRRLLTDHHLPVADGG